VFGNFRIDQLVAMGFVTKIGSFFIQARETRILDNISGENRTPSALNKPRHCFARGFRDWGRLFRRNEVFQTHFPPHSVRAFSAS
jgi:hypothetical protein